MQARGRQIMGQAALPCIPTTVTIQRVGPLDLSSITERTIPAMVDPINVNGAFSPRYWAYWQHLASFGPVVSTVSMILPKIRYVKRLRDPPARYQRNISKDSGPALPLNSATRVISPPHALCELPASDLMAS
jgi:hypothetical protein